MSPAKKKIALVFRSIGERTADLSLELAKENIRPDAVHVIENVRPFARAVDRMLEIDYSGMDLVVAMDADCLIVEDLRPFLDDNDQPYVDSYVWDQFRGRIHCGVHFTRVDVMQEMANKERPHTDQAYVLRPESRLRKLALNAMDFAKCQKSHRIYHDYFQYKRDIFAKYALRELRARTPEQKRKLDHALSRWESSLDPDEEVARLGVAWARREYPESPPPAELAAVIASLPDRGAEEIAANGIEEKPPLTRAEVEAFDAAHRERWPDPPKGTRVFGLGLSRTGTRSLTTALHILGIDTVHYPMDEGTFEALSSGRLDFPLLRTFHGLTDITVAPYYAELDRLYPDARFVLTVREPEGWLRSCESHWSGREAFAPSEGAVGHEIHMRIRRFLRAAVYGCYDFQPERFRRVYEKHVRDVVAYFADRPGKLLIYRIVDGDGWEPLCRFLERPIPDQPFPHRGATLTAELAALGGDPDD